MIYVAGPFFNEEERNNLNEMIAWIKKRYYQEDLFIPMEHFIPDGESLPNHEWARKVYAMDVSAIKRCDMVIAMYMGHYSDTGTAWEIGYAQALGKPVYIWVPKSCQHYDMSMMPLCASSFIQCDIKNLNMK